MRQWLFYKVTIPGMGSQVLKRHLAIFRAIAQHKPLAARREMRLHLEEAAVVITQAIRERMLERKLGRKTTKAIG
jgi:DNA-binding GntR family transcriptional regulator